MNTYNAAFFTWSFLQFGAHTPNGDFVQFFRKLIADPVATSYFPDLVLAHNRICRIERVGHVPLESDASTQPLMTYLNPSVNAVEEIEVVDAAKLLHWSTLTPPRRVFSRSPQASTSSART